MEVVRCRRHWNDFKKIFIRISGSRGYCCARNGGKGCLNGVMFEWSVFLRAMTLSCGCSEIYRTGKFALASANPVTLHSAFNQPYPKLTVTQLKKSCETIVTIVMLTKYIFINIKIFTHLEMGEACFLFWQRCKTQ